MFVFSELLISLKDVTEKVDFNFRYQEFGQVSKTWDKRQVNFGKCDHAIALSNNSSLDDIW